MKTKAKLICCALLLSTIIMLPAAVRPESAVLLYGKANKLFEQIQDLELLQRNIEQCYQSEKGTLRVASFARQSWGEPAELDGQLINRVFGHLADAPEYERFVKAHGALIQRPDYRRLYADELFAEYMRLLEAGRKRLTTQLKGEQESLVEGGSVQAYEGSAQAGPGKPVAVGYLERSKRTESGRIVPAVGEEVKMSLSSRIVVPGTDQPGSPHTDAH
jgi:hypothetical protein